MLGIDDDTNMRKQNALKQGRRSRNVTFNDEEIIINPEDVDPNVGRFRNLVQTTVVPAKRARFDVNHMGIHSGSSLSSANAAHVHQLFQQSLADMKHQQHMSSREMPLPNAVPHSPTNSLYQGLPAEAHGKGDLEPISPLSIGSKLGLLLPNPAPEVLPVFDEALEPTSTLEQKLAVANANGKVFRSGNLRIIQLISAFPFSASLCGGSARLQWRGRCHVSTEKEIRQGGLARPQAHAWAAVKVSCLVSP